MQRLSQLGPVIVLTALDLGGLLQELTDAAVQIVGYGAFLGFETEPRPALPCGTHSVVGDELALQRVFKNRVTSDRRFCRTGVQPLLIEGCSRPAGRRGPS